MTRNQKTKTTNTQRKLDPFTFNGWIKRTDEKKEMMRDVTHLVTFELPNMIPYIRRKKQEAAMQITTKIHAISENHQGSVNFFFIL